MLRGCGGEEIAEMSCDVRTGEDISMKVVIVVFSRRLADSVVYVWLLSKTREICLEGHDFFDMGEARSSGSHNNPSRRPWYPGLEKIALSCHRVEAPVEEVAFERPPLVEGDKVIIAALFDRNTLAATRGPATTKS